MPGFKIEISTPADLSGIAATKAGLEDLIKLADGTKAGATGAATAGTQAAASTSRLAQAAAATPSAPLASLAAAARQVTANTQAATMSMGALTQQSNSFLSTVQLGFGVGFGEKLIDGIEAIGHAFTAAVEKGVEYDASMETLSIGIAAKLRSVEPEKYLDFSAARAKGTEALDELRTRANVLGLDVHALADSFAVTLPSLVEAGVTSTADQINVLIRLSQIAQANNITGARAVRDILAELQGRGSKTTFGAELEGFGITNASVKEAIANGTLANEILSKTPGYAEQAGAAADSYKGSLASIKNEITSLEGELAKPIFTKLTELFQGGKGALGSTEASGIAQGLGNSISGTIEGFESIAKGIEGFWERHPMLKKFNETLNLVTPEGLAFKGAKDNIDAGDANAEVDAQIKLVKNLQEQIATAKDAKAEGEARAAVENAIAAASARVASAQGDAKDRAHDFLIELQDIQSHLDTHLGQAKPDTEAADKRGKQDSDAYAKYNARPAATCPASVQASRQTAPGGPHQAASARVLVPGLPCPS